jgi:hypothetical membrane protein
VLTVASLAVQPAVVAAVTTPYSVTEQAISDLGVTSCGAAPQDSGTQTVVCSPWWPLMDAGIVVGGLAMVAAGLLLRGRSLGGAAVTVLLVVAGLSTVGAGAVPLDVSRPWHVALASPLFVAQNLALLLMAGPLARRGRGWRPTFLVAGTVGLLGTLAVVVPIGVPFGLAERAGAYPAVIVLAALGVSVLRSARRHGAS